MLTCGELNDIGCEKFQSVMLINTVATPNFIPKLMVLIRQVTSTVKLLKYNELIIEYRQIFIIIPISTMQKVTMSNKTTHPFAIVVHSCGPAGIFR